MFLFENVLMFFLDNNYRSCAFYIFSSESGGNVGVAILLSKLNSVEKFDVYFTKILTLKPLIART